MNPGLFRPLPTHATLPANNIVSLLLIGFQLLTELFLERNAALSLQGRQLDWRLALGVIDLDKDGAESKEGSESFGEDFGEQMGRVRAGVTELMRL